MSASGSHDPRLNRADPGDVATSRLHGAIDSARTIPGAGMRGGRGFGGNALAVSRPRPVRAARRHPFEIIDASYEDETKRPSVKVHLDSWLLGSRAADDKVTITGLGEAFEIAVGDYIWIEIGVSGSAVTGSASIEHGSAPWASYPQPFDDVGTAQSGAYMLIGYVQAYPGEGTEVAGLPSDYPDRLRIHYKDGDDDAELQIVQSLTTNLIVSQECEDTDTVIGLAPWSGVPAP